MAQHLAGVDHTDDVVDGVLEDGDAAVALLDDDAGHLVERGVAGDGNDVRAGDHNLAGGGLFERHDPPDHLALFGVHGAAAVLHLRQAQQFFCVVGWLLSARSRPTQKQAGGKIQEHRRRTQCKPNHSNNGP